MGNREALLDGATQCLYDKGYARTTARDIATAAGVSLAAIGYHYGSKEALLDAALQRAIESWGDRLAGTLADAGRAGGAEQFERTWAGVLASLAEDRPLWAVQFELIAHLQRTPELRHSYAEATRRARLELATIFGTDPADEATALRIGAFYQALLVGVVGLWLVDPDGAPTSTDLLDAVRTVGARLAPG
ncbi:TetR family transcriptional regulator [Actinocatenispora thailandica]|uniref:TetR family transcriptional regulator n=1 Tax=Actinocatenispora thailandica TaxID=227318 RepID=A0A7R7HUP4_9ACTN|nr:TetR/AcrR family transcriptional regulator [Actinocatenispora thailandica]BCJ32676.1 TetR family transcriptional regulator [Actinocatenispora thailandica]